MTTFPLLKTGAVAQYPLEASVRFSTEAVQFLDGSEQRFKLFSRGLRRWVVRLDLLDDQELGAVIDFVDAVGSMAFAFSDPASGLTAANCVIAGERFDATMTGEMTGQATVVVEEIA